MDASEFARYSPRDIPGDARAYKGAGRGDGSGSRWGTGYGSGCGSRWGSGCGTGGGTVYSDGWGKGDGSGSGYISCSGR